MGFIVIILCLNISGCIDEEQIIVKVPLDSIALKLEDLEGNYSKSNEQYIVEPYIVEEGLLLAGWEVYEKYDVFFNTEDENNFELVVAAFKSNENAKEAINSIRVNYSSNFDEIFIDLIGNLSYLGENSSIFENKTIQLLSFSIDNVVVIIFGTIQSREILINYAKIIENNYIKSLSE